MKRSGGLFTRLQNQANGDAHYAGTAPEIWAQTAGTVDAFICACKCPTKAVVLVTDAQRELVAQ